MGPDGNFSNASGCGNETASERPMVRKFIIDSILYWTKEYHIDGFRFDLMGIHDIKTMNEIRLTLNEIDPTILVYGEGWTGGLCMLPEGERAMKCNMMRMDSHIAAFNDNIRDAIKGSVFNAPERGYVNGQWGLEESIKFGVVASTSHDCVDYARVKYSKSPWAAEPTQTINYVSAHDNFTLWDKLAQSNPWESREDRIKMNCLSAAIILTSQGIPFYQAGEEFLRSKPKNEANTAFDDNSYRSPDSINSLKWNLVTENKEVVDYYKGLIVLRKENDAFRMVKAEEIRKRLTFLPWEEPNVVSFLIKNSNGQEFCVGFNPNYIAKTIHIPDGEWNVYVKGNKAGTQILETIKGTEVVIEPISAIVMMR
ncbi:MAG: type I pullulanase, partial [Mobilitalea sp.]